MSNISLLGSLDRKTLLSLKAREADEIGGVVDISSYTDLIGVTLNSTACTAGTLDVSIQSSPEAVAGELDNTATDTGLGLRLGATDNVALAKSFTQEIRAELARVRIPLKAVGTIADGKSLTLSLHADDSGAPASAATASSATVPCSQLTTNYELTPFDFSGNAPTMEAATNYHLVLTGDYTSSSVNYVMWGGEEVTGGGDGEILDSAWTNSDTINFGAQSDEYHFSEIGAFARVGTSASSDQTINLLADDIDQYLRVVADVATGPVTSIVTVTALPDRT